MSNTERLVFVGLVAFLAAPRAQAGEPDGVRIVASRDDVVLGADASTDVQIDVEIPGAADGLDASALRLHCTAGELGAIEKVGPRQFRAVLRAPREAFPQLAVVSAALVNRPVPVVQTVVIAYSARLVISGQSEDHSQIRVDVGGKAFGPFTADARGAFTMDLVVPPGVGHATAVAKDVLGNTSRSRINLFLPDVVRLHTFVYPESLVAGEGRGFIFAASVSASGLPESTQVSVRADRGTIERVDAIAPGITRIAYTAPKQILEGWDRVALASDKGAAIQQKVRLVAGAPVRFVTRSEPAVIAADGATRAKLVAEVYDAWDNLVSGQRVVARLEGQTLVLDDRGNGRYETELSPRTKMGSAVAAMTVENAPTALALEQRLTWRPKIPLTLKLRVVARSAESVRLALVASEAAPLRERVRVSSSTGKLVVDAVGESELALVLSPAPAPGAFVDVVATDSASGAATRLRVE